MSKHIVPKLSCKDGVSLSIQASSGHYCIPRKDDAELYIEVEVGFIEKEGETNQYKPPKKWKKYSDGTFPSDVYSYVPVELVLNFITKHGGLDENEPDYFIIKNNRLYFTKKNIK